MKAMRPQTIVDIQPWTRQKINAFNFDCNHIGHNFPRTQKGKKCQYFLIGTKANCWLGDMLRGLSIGLPGGFYDGKQIINNQMILDTQWIAKFNLATTAIGNEVAWWATWPISCSSDAAGDDAGRGSIFWAATNPSVKLKIERKKKTIE